jgi:Putative zinc- or iron-chelating domain
MSLAAKNEEKIDERSVPCGTCQACCRREWIFLDRAAGDIAELYETETVIDPATGKPTLAIAHKENGDCIYQDAAGCSIHSRRPYLCRIFDCRLYHLDMRKRPRGERRHDLLHQFKAKEIDAIGAAMLRRYPLDDSK